MEKDQNKERQLSEIFKSVENSLNIVSDYPDSIVHQEAKSLSKDFKELRQGFKGMKLVLLFSTIVTIISIVICVVLMINYNKINELNSQLVESSIPTKHDSLKNKILNEKDGTINYITDKNGKVITYQNLSEIQDTLMLKTFQYQDTIADLKLKLSMAKRVYGIDYLEEQRGVKKYVTIKSTKFDNINDGLKRVKNQTKPLVDSVMKNK